MDLRNANIGLAVTAVMIVIGALWVGPGASDTEVKLICWPALGVGFIIVLVLEDRDERRSRGRPPR
jgi:energy-converting hydrogenase Eha subunit E